MKILMGIALGLILGLGFTYIIHNAFQYYNLNSEIQDFSYAALGDNIERYPNDKELLNQISESLSDKKIIGSEHKAIFDQLIKKNGIYHGAKMDEDHSNAKQELITGI